MGRGEPTAESQYESAAEIREAIRELRQGLHQSLDNMDGLHTITSTYRGKMDCILELVGRWTCVMPSFITGEGVHANRLAIAMIERAELLYNMIDDHCCKQLTKGDDSIVIRALSDEMREVERLERAEDTTIQ